FPPERIICLTEETVETLYLLGEESRIVGISGYVVRPPKARREKPRVMSEVFDPTDYSFVVKRRGTPQKPWRWEIYCAGKSGPVERSPVFCESMAEAAKAGKKALGPFLAKRAA